MRALRSPQDAAAGLFLLIVGTIALWNGFKLSAGTLSQIGPGMLPRALALLTSLCGVGLLIGAFFRKGEGLERWRLRQILFVIGGTLVFGFAIRPLGMLVAVPAVALISALASEESRLVEIIVFSVVITAVCIGLFRYALGLPIPVAPWLIGY